MDVRMIVLFVWILCVAPVIKAHSALGFSKETKVNETSPEQERHPSSYVNLKKEAANQKTPTRKEMSFDEVSQKMLRVSEQGKTNEGAEDLAAQGDGAAALNSDTIGRVQSFYNELVNNMRRNGHRFHPSKALHLSQSDDGKLWPMQPYGNSQETPGNGLKKQKSLPIQLSFGAQGDLAVPIGKINTQTDSNLATQQNNGVNMNQQDMTSPGMLENVMFDGLTSVQGGNSQGGGSQNTFGAGTGFGGMGFQGNTLNTASSATMKRERLLISSTQHHGNSNEHGSFKMPASLVGRAGVKTKVQGTASERRRFALAKDSLHREEHDRKKHVTSRQKTQKT